MSSAISRTSSLKGGVSGGLDPIVKDKDLCRKIAYSLSKFFEDKEVRCTDFDFHASLKQLKNLPTARLVREMYNFFFLELLSVSIPAKSSNEIILTHLKTLDYPYAVHKSSIMNPNNSSSWPYNLAILSYLRDVYILVHPSVNDVGETDFEEKDGMLTGIDLDFDGQLQKTVDLDKTAKEDLPELKRIMRSMVSRDMVFMELLNDVKARLDARDDLRADLEEKSQDFEQHFGSLEQFEEIMAGIAKSKRELAELSCEVEQCEREKELASVAFGQARNKCKMTLEEIERLLLLHFPSKSKEVKACFSHINWNNCHESPSHDFSKFDQLKEDLVEHLENREAEVRAELEATNEELSVLHEEVVELREKVENEEENYMSLRAREQSIQRNLLKIEEQKERAIEKRDLKDEELSMRLKEWEQHAKSALSLAHAGNKQFQKDANLCKDLAKIAKEKN